AVLQTQRSNLFDAVGINVSRTVVREFSDARTRPKITERAVGAIGLNRGYIQTTHELSSPCLSLKFKSSANRPAPFAKNNYRALREQIGQVSRMHIVGLKTDSADLNIGQDWRLNVFTKLRC